MRSIIVYGALLGALAVPSAATATCKRSCQASLVMAYKDGTGQVTYNTLGSVNRALNFSASVAGSCAQRVRPARRGRRKSPDGQCKWLKKGGTKAELALCRACGLALKAGVKRWKGRDTKELLCLETGARRPPSGPFWPQRLHVRAGGTEPARRGPEKVYELERQLFAGAKGMSGPPLRCATCPGASRRIRGACHEHKAAKCATLPGRALLGKSFKDGCMYTPDCTGPKGLTKRGKAKAYACKQPSSLKCPSGTKKLQRWKNAWVCSKAPTCPAGFELSGLWPNTPVACIKKVR